MYGQLFIYLGSIDGFKICHISQQVYLKGHGLSKMRKHIGN